MALDFGLLAEMTVLIISAKVRHSSREAGIQSQGSDL